MKSIRFAVSGWDAEDARVRLRRLGALTTVWRSWLWITKSRNNTATGKDPKNQFEIRVVGTETPSTIWSRRLWLLTSGVFLFHFVSRYHANVHHSRLLNPLRNTTPSSVMQETPRKFPVQSMAHSNLSANPFLARRRTARLMNMCSKVTQGLTLPRYVHVLSSP